MKRGFTVLVVTLAVLSACGDDDSSSGWIPAGATNPDLAALATAPTTPTTGVTPPPAPTTVPAGAVPIVVGTSAVPSVAPVATTPAATDEADAASSDDSGDGGDDNLDLGVDQDEAAQQIRDAFTAIGVDLTDDQVDCLLDKVAQVGGNATDFDQMVSIYAECGIDLASIMGS